LQLAKVQKKFQNKGNNRISSDCDYGKPVDC